MAFVRLRWDHPMMKFNALDDVGGGQGRADHGDGRRKARRLSTVRWVVDHDRATAITPTHPSLSLVVLDIDHHLVTGRLYVSLHLDRPDL